MSKPKNTSCATVQGQKWTKPNTQKKNGMFKKSLDHFFFRTKGGEHKKAELFVTTTTQTNKRKGKKSGVGSGVCGGVGQCIQRQAHHALDGNRSWFGHLA